MDSSAFLIDHPSLASSVAEAAPAAGSDEASDTLPMPAGSALDDAPLAVSLKDVAGLAAASQGFSEFMDSISVPDDTRRNALSLLIRSHRSALTDLSRMQRELSRSRAEVEALAADLADASDLAGLLSWTFTISDRTLQVSQSLCDLVGWPIDVPVPRNLSHLMAHVFPDDRDAVRGMLMQVFRRGVAERGQARLLDRSGQPFTVQLRLRPLAGMAGRTLGVRALMRVLDRDGSQAAGAEAGDVAAGVTEAPTEAGATADDGHALGVQDVVQALKTEAFHPVYQVVVDGLSGQTLGAESLVRWRHPQRGEVMPGEFLPLCEQAGLDGQLTRLMVRQACRYASDWRAVGDNQACVSVNLSQRQLARSELVWDIIDALAESGLPPDALMLEIDELTLAQDASAHAELIQYLKQTGVRIAIDNVGANPGALRRLAGLQIDCIKLDRKLVCGIEHGEGAATLRSLVAHAGGLGIDVVAKGVETAAQRDALLAYGCRQMQGFLFARPTDARAFAAPAS